MVDQMPLMMAQVDDVSGEILGEFIRRAEKLGARNIQVVPSLTKKGRPSHIVFVDAPEHIQPDIGLLLGSVLGTWGYRILQSEHRHFDIRRTNALLRVATGAETLEFNIRVNVVSHEGQVMRVKAEFDDLSKACETLREANRPMSIHELKAAVEDLFIRSTRNVTLKLHLP
jgi:pyridinium-3,5-bisthiocarboxylic acid mononucleotide nickel chelatase